MPELASPPCSVFISYAHADDNDTDLSKRYAHRCQRQLSLLTRQGRAVAYSDKAIKSGDLWRESIQNGLENARVAILLVGPEFLNSEFIRNVEVPWLLEKVDSRRMTLLLVILSPVLLNQDPFKYPDPETGPKKRSLSAFQCVNPPEAPLTSMREHEQEEVFVEAARRTLELLEAASPTVIEDAGPESKGHVRAVEGALDLLSDLVRASGKVRKAVRRFRSTFEVASENIERVSAFKALHDFLHVLQLRCLDLITVELGLFPDESESEVRLIGPEQDLQRTIASITAAASRWAKVDFATTRLLEDLNAVHSDLLSALENQDHRKLRDAHFLLDRVLNTYPSKINTLLTEAARRLGLPTLFGAMAELKTQLVDLGVRQDQLQAFVEGTESLSVLDIQLRALLYEHDGWQVADGEMRIAQLNGDQFFESLQSFWPRLKIRTEILYRENPAEMAQQLEIDSTQLDKALAAENPSKAKSAYFRFRRYARLRFFEVDTELLRLCDSFKEVGTPLDKILQRLDPEAY